MDETGNDCRGMACDVTDRDAIARAVAATAAAFGGISTLVNNVGWGGRQPDPTDIPDSEFIKAFALNTISAYRMSMACLPWLEKSDNATITNSGSFSSAVPAYDILPYATAKAALNQMMVSIAHLLNKKVRVSSVLIGGNGAIDRRAATPSDRLAHPTRSTHGGPSWPDGPFDVRHRRHRVAADSDLRSGSKPALMVEPYAPRHIKNG